MFEHKQTTLWWRSISPTVYSMSKNRHVMPIFFSVNMENKVIILCCSNSYIAIINHGVQSLTVSAESCMIHLKKYLLRLSFHEIEFYRLRTTKLTNFIFVQLNHFCIMVAYLLVLYVWLKFKWNFACFICKRQYRGFFLYEIQYSYICYGLYSLEEFNLCCFEDNTLITFFDKRALSAFEFVNRLASWRSQVCTHNHFYLDQHSLFASILDYLELHST